MKTIFRYTNIGLLAVAIFAAGAVTTFAQDPCTDAEGQTTSGDKIRELYKDKSIPGRKTFVEAGKQFTSKYGACDVTKELVTWLGVQIPNNEKKIKEMEEAEIENKLVTRFDASITAKNWDETFASGKEILQKYPEKYRTVEVVLASVGGEEAFKANYKYIDDAIRYAKVSIDDLESGKSFMVGGKEAIGLFAFSYPNKNDAIGWMNLYIGYMTQAGKKDKAAAAPYLYKATQSSSDAAKNPVYFEMIGAYYFDELNKVVEKIQLAAKDQKDTDAPDVAAKKVEDIKALVAMSNGISERAMDAFSRAFTLAKDAAYKARMKKNVADAYKVRYAKEEGVDAWITSAVAKPFVNPTTPVAPISDPEPTTTTTTGTTGTSVGVPSGTGIGAANGTGIGAANGTGTGGAKPAATTAKPAPAKPAGAAPIKPSPKK